MSTAPCLHASTRRPPTHLQPLDSVIQALEATTCTWCQGLLRLLKQHLEADILSGWEVLN
ncbi:MAG: hypothetical protein M3380_16890 [Chloroflexota bacterium]|nr:hypothetical protein [Chloroflexota bacterium]